MLIPGHPHSESPAPAAYSIPVAQGERSVLPDRSYPSTGRRDPQWMRPIRSDGTCRSMMQIPMSMMMLISEFVYFCTLTCGGNNSPFGTFANNSGQFGNGNTAEQEEVYLYHPPWWLFHHETRKESTGAGGIGCNTIFPLVGCRKTRDPSNKRRLCSRVNRPLLRSFWLYLYVCNDRQCSRKKEPG
jgi:hypothetical protein